MDVRAFVCSASLPAELCSGARDPGRLGETGSRLRWRVFSTYGLHSDGARDLSCVWAKHESNVIYPCLFVHVCIGSRMTHEDCFQP